MGQGAADGHYGAIFPLHEGRTMRRETLGRKETQRSLEVSSDAGCLSPRALAAGARDSDTMGGSNGRWVPTMQECATQGSVCGNGTTSVGYLLSCNHTAPFSFTTQCNGQSVSIMNIL